MDGGEVRNKEGVVPEHGEGASWMVEWSAWRPRRADSQGPCARKTHRADSHGPCAKMDIHHIRHFGCCPRPDGGASGHRSERDIRCTRRLVYSVFVILCEALKKRKVGPSTHSPYTTFLGFSLFARSSRARLGSLRFEVAGVTWARENPRDPWHDILWSAESITEQRVTDLCLRL